MPERLFQKHPTLRGARVIGTSSSAAKAERTAKLTHQKAFGEFERDIRERERDRQQAEARAIAWDREWTLALSRTWFADKGHSIASIRAILAVIGTLPAILKERQDLASRVAAMERDQAQFALDIAGLLTQCGEDQLAGNTLAAANTLTQRHERARRCSQLRADKQAELEKQLEKQRAFEEEVAVHNARRSELMRYFDFVATRLDLRKHYRFNTRVLRVEPVNDTPESPWRVTVQKPDGSQDSAVYKGVVIANGTLAEPNMPRFEGRFDGELLHTSAYKHAEQFKGKRVLIVGAGNSGCDIAVDAVHQGAERHGPRLALETRFDERRSQGLPILAQPGIGVIQPAIDAHGPEQRDPGQQNEDPLAGNRF